MESIFSPGAIQDKVCIITGGGRGLGRTMALALAKAGGDIVLAARSLDQIEKAADEISGLGRHALPICTDVKNAGDILRMAEKALSEFGKIDVLVNNAGQVASFAHHRFEDIPEKEWMDLIQTNVNGTFLVSKTVGKIMLDQGKGNIINIASTFGVKPMPTHLCYSVSKAAVIHMSKGMALEWAGRGVRVNCIAPGSFELPGSDTNKRIAEVNEERRKRVPVGRLGRAEELGPLVVFLASSASDYITGETVYIDGGLAVK
jgi:NAD(P)-dependent dehydrogenase (short-subunit alcohol dehydrogenase family)